jgi:hypothetical protein
MPVDARAHAETLAAARLARMVKNLITAFGAAILLFFTFLEIWKAPFDKITETFQPYSFVKLGLFLFYLGWLAGATDDTDIQHEALRRDTSLARLDPLEYSGIGAFFALFALLFYFRESIVIFQAVLLAFIVLNVGTYRIILRRIDRNVRNRRDELLGGAEKDYFGYLKLYCLMGYAKGSWQAKRFKTLIVLAALQLAVAAIVYTEAYRQVVGDRPVGKLTLYTCIEYAPAFLFLCYVLVSESWMKIYRYKIKSDYVTIDKIHQHFGLQKRRGVELPPLDMSGLFDEKLDENANYVSPSLLTTLRLG